MCFMSLFPTEKQWDIICSGNYVFISLFHTGIQWESNDNYK